MKNPNIKHYSGLEQGLRSSPPTYPSSKDCDAPVLRTGVTFENTTDEPLPCGTVIGMLYFRTPVLLLGISHVSLHMKDDSAFLNIGWDEYKNPTGATSDLDLDGLRVTRSNLALPDRYSDQLCNLNETEFCAPVMITAQIDGYADSVMHPDD